MSHNVRPLSEHQRRIQLLAYLGFVPGKSMGEGQALVNWHFGTRGTYTEKGRTFVKGLPGKNPMHVPSWRIAQFLAYYGPQKWVPANEMAQIKKDYNLA